MKTQRLDPLRYLPSPRVDVRAGISLGRMLLAALPDDPAPSILPAAQALEAAVEDLATQWTARLELRSTEDIRPYDHHLDRAWAAVHGSLARYANLDYEHPDHERAAELVALLFPTGLDFIRLPYLRQHAESDRRVEFIDAQGLRDDLDRLVGEPFIDDLLEAHQAFGEALEITEASEDNEKAPPISLAAPLRTLTRAMSRYALQVLAFADLDPDKIAVARRALEPIDMVRRANARRKANRSVTEAENDKVPTTEPQSNTTDPEITTSAA